MANEKRLIDANALIEQIRLMANRTSLGEISPSSISGLEVCHLILTAPTVDAVEVVRCRDCKHRYNGKDCTHPLLLSYSWGAIRKVKDDDFCSYGERKGK